MSNQRYSPEFKGEAVRQILNREYSVAEVSERFGVPCAMNRWRRSRYTLRGKVYVGWWLYTNLKLKSVHQGGAFWVCYVLAANYYLFFR